MNSYDSYLEAPFQEAEAKREKVLQLVEKAVQDKSLLEDVLDNEPKLISKTVALLQSLMTRDNPDESVTEFMEEICDNYWEMQQEPDLPDLPDDLPLIEEALDTLYPDDFFQQQTDTFGPIPDKYKRLAEARDREQKSEGEISHDS